MLKEFYLNEINSHKHVIICVLKIRNLLFQGFVHVVSGNSLEWHRGVFYNPSCPVQCYHVSIQAQNSFFIFYTAQQQHVSYSLWRYLH